MGWRFLWGPSNTLVPRNFTGWTGESGHIRTDEYLNMVTEKPGFSSRTKCYSHEDFPEKRLENLPANVKVKSNCCHDTPMGVP